MIFLAWIWIGARSGINQKKLVVDNLNHLQDQHIQQVYLHHVTYWTMCYRVWKLKFIFLILHFSHNWEKMHTLLPIVAITPATIAAIGAYQDYLILGTSSYMQLSPKVFSENSSLLGKYSY